MLYNKQLYALYLKVCPNKSICKYLNLAAISHPFVYMSPGNIVSFLYSPTPHISSAAIMNLAKHATFLALLYLACVALPSPD